MVQNHKVMLVLGLLIWYVGEAANPVRKQMVSGNVGADVDADFSDIKEASFVRKQVKADGNIDASDVEAERPIRKHANSWKVGANGEVGFSGPKTSLVRKQTRANASIDASANDCPAGGFCIACGTCSPGRCADGSCPLFDGKCTCGDGSCPSKVASNICQACPDISNAQGPVDKDFWWCGTAQKPNCDAYTYERCPTACNFPKQCPRRCTPAMYESGNYTACTCVTTPNTEAENEPGRNGMYPGGCQACVDCSAKSRASTETGDGSFCYRLNSMVSTNPNVCDGYWARGRNQATRSPCVYADAASSRSGVARCQSGPVPCCLGSAN